MSKSTSVSLRVGIAVAPPGRAQWIDLLLASQADVETVVWSSATPDTIKLEAVVIDADQPGAGFLDWYRRITADGSVPALLVLGTAMSPVMQAIEWDEEKTGFLPKPHPLETLREVLLSKVSQWKQSGFTPAKQPLGYLSSLAVPDLLQMLCQSLWSGCVTATELENRRVAQVYLKNGQLIHAESPSLTGEESFIDLVGWGKCEFYFTEKHPPVVASVTRHWQELLLEGVRRLDESRREHATG